MSKLRSGQFPVVGVEFGVFGTGEPAIGFWGKFIAS